MHFLKANIKKVSLSIMLTIMFIFWLFSYLSNKTILSIKLAYPMECILLILIGIYACITLSLLKENYYTLMMVAFVPFVYSHPFDAKTIPWSLFIAIILAFIGLIIRVIRFKFHFKIRPFFYGIVLLAIACLLGGIGNKAVFKSQIGLMLLFSIGLVLLFVYFSSENNCEFQDLALVFVFLGIYLTLQLCISYITQDNFVHTFIYKEISVGWGISNNIAIILLMLLPFTYYFILNKRGIFKIFYTLILIMETIAIFFTNSLGAISVVPILLLGLFIYGCVQTPYKKEFVVTQIMALCLIVAIILIILSIHNIPILKLFDRFIHNNLFTLHGRVKIYKDCFLSYQRTFLVWLWNVCTF